MARKAARLERAGALTPRDRMWAAIRALAKHQDADTESAFSAVEVQFLANLRGPKTIPMAPEPVHVDSVLTYLEGLSKANPPFVTILDANRPAGRKRTELILYRLERDNGVEAPRVSRDGKPVTDGIGGERLWLAMKVLREFDYVELALAASDQDYQVKPEAAKTYLYHLERAGYVAVAVPCTKGVNATRTRFRFNRAKNTGPRAPLVCRDKSVMDANTGRVVAEARR